MILNIDIPKVTEAVEGRLDDALVVIGAQGVSWAADRMRANGSVVTSNLINSLTYSTDKEQGPVGGKTDGTSIASPGKEHSVHIGSNVVYAARVEFGFSGTDSLGRTYNQPAKSYLRAAIMANVAGIKAIFARAFNGQH